MFETRLKSDLKSLHSSRSTQRLLHEPFLGEAGPPFARFPIWGLEDFLTNSLAWHQKYLSYKINAHFSPRLTCFMSELQEVLSDKICLLRSCGLGVDTIQGESNITLTDKRFSKEIFQWLISNMLPGISNLAMAREYISCRPWLLLEHFCSFLRHSVM